MIEFMFVIAGLAGLALLVMGALCFADDNPMGGFLAIVGLVGMLTIAVGIHVGWKEDCLARGYIHYVIKKKPQAEMTQTTWEWIDDSSDNQKEIEKK